MIRRIHIPFVLWWLERARPPQNEKPPSHPRDAARSVAIDHASWQGKRCRPIDYLSGEDRAFLKATAVMADLDVDWSVTPPETGDVVDRALDA
jgi:hypothetical protein